MGYQVVCVNRMTWITYTTNRIKIPKGVDIRRIPGGVRYRITWITYKKDNKGHNSCCRVSRTTEDGEDVDHDEGTCQVKQRGSEDSFHIIENRVIAKGWDGYDSHLAS